LLLIVFSLVSGVNGIGLSVCMVALLVV